MERSRIMNSVNDVWNAIMEILSKQLTSTAITTWFSDCTPVEIDDCRLVIHTTGFKRSIIGPRFGENIKAALSDLFSCDFELLILADDELNDYVTKKKDENSLPEMAGYTFDRFIVGNSNKYAHAAAIAVSKNPEFQEPSDKIPTEAISGGRLPGASDVVYVSPTDSQRIIRRPTTGRYS